MTDQSLQRFPDIEIYLSESDIDAITQWLKISLKDSDFTLSNTAKAVWRGKAVGESQSISVMLVEKAAGKFSSLWFDSDATPWPRDTDCAREAALSLNCEARCSLGGWQPGDSPDRFWQVKASGEEGVIEWPDPE